MIFSPDRIKLVAFDLDDTLAPSKTAIEPSMAKLLVGLARYVRICVISGGRFAQFESQVLKPIGNAQRDMGVDDALGRFHLMPTCGTQYYEWLDNRWTCIYSEDLLPADKEKVIDVLTSGARQLGLWEGHTWGPRLEDRGSQITFSALGQAAPVAQKAAWDPDGTKKDRLRTYAAARLPELEVRSGGSTSIDITAKGVDKAYGMRKLMARLSLTPGDVLFVGDRLDPGGNDYPVKALGIHCVAVRRWQDTVTFVSGLIQTLDPDSAASEAG